jgi:hypothetical protein
MIIKFKKLIIQQPASEKGGFLFVNPSSASGGE